MASWCRAAWPRAPSRGGRRRWRCGGRPAHAAPTARRPRRAPSRHARRSARCGDAGNPSATSSQRAQTARHGARVAVATAAAGLGPLERLLAADDRPLGEEELAQLGVEDRVVPANPLEDHGGVLFFLVAVVTQDGLELVVVAGLQA